MTSNWEKLRVMFSHRTPYRNEIRRMVMQGKSNEEIDVVIRAICDGAPLTESTQAERNINRWMQIEHAEAMHITTGWLVRCVEMAQRHGMKCDASNLTWHSAHRLVDTALNTGFLSTRLIGKIKMRFRRKQT